MGDQNEEVKRKWKEGRKEGDEGGCREWDRGGWGLLEITSPSLLAIYSKKLITWGYFADAIHFNIFRPPLITSLNFVVILIPLISQKWPCFLLFIVLIRRSTTQEKTFNNQARCSTIQKDVQQLRKMVNNPKRYFSNLKNTFNDSKKHLTT